MKRSRTSIDSRTSAKARRGSSNAINFFVLLTSSGVDRIVDQIQVLTNSTGSMQLMTYLEGWHLNNYYGPACPEP